MSFFRKKDKLDNAVQDTAASSASSGNSSSNPYLNGRNEWLERYGSYINRAAQWRGVALICLLLLGLSLAGNVLQAMQVKAIPYIVEVDKLGKAAVASKAEQASETPVRLIQADIASFISNWRTVTADIELQKQMIQRLSYFVAGSAKGVLKEWFSKNNPYEIARDNKLVHVEIKSLPLPVSADSWRVEWTETVRTHSGAAIGTQGYEATVSIMIQPPNSEAVMLQNPGGVYITSLSASRVLKDDKLPKPKNEVTKQ